MHLLPLTAAFAATCVVLLPATAQAAPSYAPPSKQVLRVNVGTLPMSLDPGEADHEADLVVQNALFAPLYRSPGGSTGALIPNLAAGQPVVSGGGLRYTVRLRAARWSDGVPITAADVKLAYTRARQQSYFGSFFDQVQSVAAVGSSTVRFDLRAPVPWFGELLASNVVTPIPSHVVRQRGARWTELRYIETSGPFEVVSGRGRTELVLGRNARWWGARGVRLQRLHLLAVTPTSASLLFRANRLDVGLRDTSVHPSAVATWKDDPRLKVVPTGQAQYLYLNTRMPALASPAVRRGIALAIDRAALANITGSGVDEPAESIVPAGVRGYAVVAGGERLLGTSGAADRPRAASELAAGGWRRGPRLTLLHPPSTFGSRVAAAVASDLLAVGVDVVPRVISQAEFAKVGVGISPVRDDVAMTLQGWMPDYSDPQSFHQLFTCANIATGINSSNFCAPEVDAAYASAIGSVTFAARGPAHRAVEDLLTGPSGHMPAVPLYEPRGEYLVQRWVHGFAQHPSGRVDFERVALLER